LSDAYFLFLCAVDGDVGLPKKGIRVKFQLRI